MLIFIIKNNGKPSDELIRLCIDKYAKYKRIATPDYQIVREEDKKPRLSSGFLEFNLSHSGIYTLIAVSEKAVGIDIQQHKETDCQKICKRFFNENDKFATIKEFFDLWAAKEAYLKKDGLCLTDGLKSDITGKNVAFFQIFEGYSVAVCSEDTDILFVKSE